MEITSRQSICSIETSRSLISMIMMNIKNKIKLLLLFLLTSHNYVKLNQKLHLDIEINFWIEFFY